MGEDAKNPKPDTAKAGMDALVASLVDSLKAQSATEQAIHNQLQSVMGATTQTVTDLVKTNVLSPDLAQENLKMQKAVINSTLSAIETLSAQAQNAAPSNKTDDKSGNGGGRS